MATEISTRDRIGRALDLLNEGLKPFVARECEAKWGANWATQAAAGLKDYQAPSGGQTDPHWDTQALLHIIWNNWYPVFGNVLGQSERNLVSELRTVRNRWAHQEPFTLDEAYRALDSCRLLLNAVSAGELAAKIDAERKAVLAEMTAGQHATGGGATRQAMLIPLEGQPTANLRPWREVVEPHPDVASGSYQVAEFVASLGDVQRGTATEEYRDPAAFFARTYLTGGLTQLLTTALKRLSGLGGDPVVELQTNFGGGKTHSLLALYHLCSGVPASQLPGVEPILQAAGVSQAPQARRAVLVGFEMSPGQASTKPDGTVVHTMWGELAWQLLGAEGYALVDGADRAGVSPGAETLRELFTRAAPSLVLIDEWIVYVRQFYGKTGLPGGSFDTNMSFVQELTEAAKSATRTLVVATIPASETEVGGDAGREALSRLTNIFHRIESPWRPANMEEGFEIVRRRLFQPITEGKAESGRDRVIKAFADMYRTQPQEFPSECREGDYARRMAATYPIHPAVFDQLYQGWASLDRFQRTRGVLRLMAAVIHSLWDGGDAGLMILPAHLPIGDDVVENRFMDYLDDPWRSVIDKDVDGVNSLPLRLDQQHPNQGRYSASRRVARTIFFGSAPTEAALPDKRGVSEAQIKLGAVQPGEQVSIFGDALRRLNDQATYLYGQSGRYWFARQPSVNRLASDRAAQYSEDDVLAEIERHLKLKREAEMRGDFDKVHICPMSTADVSDDRAAKLVILRPHDTFTAREENSRARQVAASFLEQRGNAPRRYRNTLVFLAADATRLTELKQAIREALAWDSIVADGASRTKDDLPVLNLDDYQKRQANDRRATALENVRARIPETYNRLLVPIQEEKTGPMGWREITLQGNDALAPRASKKLRYEELLMASLGGIRLRLELDRVPLWRGDAVSVRQLAEDFGQYLYLPRLKDEGLLLDAIADGVAALAWREETFAYAEGYDEARGRYLGLRAGERIVPSLEGGALLVKPAVAAAQLAADAADASARASAGAEAGGAAATYAPLPSNGSGIHEPGVVGSGAPSPSPAGAAKPQYTRFHGTKSLEATRMVRDADEIAKEVLQHLTRLAGAQVEVTLEVHARLPEGASEELIRTVTENCRTMNFRSFGFEEN